MKPLSDRFDEVLDFTETRIVADTAGVSLDLLLGVSPYCTIVSMAITSLIRRVAPRIVRRGSR